MAFDQVRRVLADDGTVWLNVGDSYTSGNRKYRAPDRKNRARAMSVRPPTPAGLRAKDLIGVPWRLAFALQDTGWWVRSEVIWYKPNAHPESVRDRPKKSHETVSAHHGATVEALGLTTFEVAFQNACEAVGWKVTRPQSATQRFIDATVDAGDVARKLSLKSTAQQRLSLTTAHISKLTEAAWIQDVRSASVRRVQTRPLPCSQVTRRRTVWPGRLPLETLSIPGGLPGRRP